MGTGFPFLILGSLKNTIYKSNMMLEKMCEAIREHGPLYSKTGQEVADIQSTVASIDEAQKRYSLCYSGL
jgi:hypothetical protein